MNPCDSCLHKRYEHLGDGKTHVIPCPSEYVMKAQMMEKQCSMEDILQMRYAAPEEKMERLMTSHFPNQQSWDWDDQGYTYLGPYTNKAGFFFDLGIYRPTRTLAYMVCGRHSLSDYNLAVIYGNEPGDHIGGGTTQDNPMHQEVVRRWNKKMDALRTPPQR